MLCEGNHQLDRSGQLPHLVGVCLSLASRGLDLLALTSTEFLSQAAPDFLPDCILQV